MNKTQLICLLVTILLVMTAGAWIHGRSHYRHYVLAHGRMIGEELIESTNSTHVVQLGADLKGYLEKFLRSPAVFEEVVLGDDSVGDGTADACVFLQNERGERLGIRIRQADVPQRFHILGYWTAAGDVSDAP